MSATLLALLLNGFAFLPDDSIELLVAGLNQEPIWQNGFTPTFDLPAEASPAQVAGLVLSKRGFEAPERPLFVIHCSQSIIIGKDTYTASHCFTEFGERIVLMRYEKKYWEARVYDVKVIRAFMKENEKP
jgi:hypothetical protein